MEKALGVWYFLALRVAFANSFRRVVRMGVHQALDLWDRRERGLVASIVVVRAERVEENHWSSWLGEGVSEAAGTSHSLSIYVRPGQSASCQRGLCLSQWGDGGRREITIGVWSDP